MKEDFIKYLSLQKRWNDQSIESSCFFESSSWLFQPNFEKTKLIVRSFFDPPPPPHKQVLVFSLKNKYNKTQQDFSKLVTWGTFGSHLEALGVWRYKQAKVQVDHQAAETDVQPKERCFFCWKFILRRLGGFFPPKKQTQTPKNSGELVFLFFGELKKGPGVGWFVIWWFGLFWVCFFFTNQQLTVTADQSVGWDVWVFFPEGQGFGEEVFFYLGFPGSFQGIPRTPEALNEPLMSPLPRAV